MGADKSVDVDVFGRLSGSYYPTGPAAASEGAVAFAAFRVLATSPSFHWREVMIDLHYRDLQSRNLQRERIFLR